jgi:hypothetical protein
MEDQRLTKRVFQTPSGWRLDVTSEWARLYAPTDLVGVSMTPAQAFQFLSTPQCHPDYEFHSKEG